MSAGVDVVAAISETIRERKEVPSGELYARVMGYATLDEFEKIISLLKRANVVAEANHVLRWIGPVIP